MARDSGNEERSRRLESDDEAVQILTIHRSKGLEFPIVLCPDLWDGRRPTRNADWIAFHEPVHGDQRTIDVGAAGPELARHLTQHNAEQRGEDLRLAYVALTRARHQAVLWWAGSFDSRHSALARLLFVRDDDDSGSLRLPTPTDEAVVARLTELAEAVPGCIGVEVTSAPDGPVARWSRPRPAAAKLTVARFGRVIDASWRRTSYSDITADAHDPIVASEPEEGVVADEPVLVAAAAPPVADSDEDEAALRPCPRCSRRCRSASTSGRSCTACCRRPTSRRPTSTPSSTRGSRSCRRAGASRSATPGSWRRGSRRRCARRSGPLLHGRRLCDVARADRLDELEFELPLAGGEAAGDGAGLQLAALGALLREHSQPATRSPATPTACPTPRCATACAAT